MASIYKEFCWHCLDKDRKPLEIPIKKTKELTKEMREMVAESERKYGKPGILKRYIYKGCPKCKRTIVLHPVGYLDFYYPSKEKKETMNKMAEKIGNDIKESILKDMPEENNTEK